MSLEINWFDIELRGLCIINTHIMTRYVNLSTLYKQEDW